MRNLILAFPLILALGACNAADNTAAGLGNAADNAGNVIESGASEVGNTAGAVADAASNGAADIGNAVAGAPDRDGWAGRWKGVEGTNLVISKGDAPGRYKLEMQYTLDDKGSFDGTATADGIAFTRPDGAQVLRASNGDATGLKWLAGKKDCLKVKDGEGYCRH